MGHRTATLEHPPQQRHEAPNLDFRNLLVEAYQEREALLRGDIKLIAGPATTADAPSDRPFVADVSDRDVEPRRRQTRPSDAGVAHWPREPADAHVPRSAELAEIIGPGRRLPPRRQDRAALPPEISALAKSVARTATKLPASVARNVAEAFLPAPERETNHDVALQRLWRRGVVLIAVFGGAMAFWSIATSMSGAVIAPGQFVVDGSVKKVQHPTGGVVGELLVRDGDQVEEGDLLIRLDETVTRANLQVIVRQLDELDRAQGAARGRARRASMRSICRRN